MKKILLTSIVGLMTLVPNMANAGISYGILLEVLRDKKFDNIDRNKFTNHLSTVYQNNKFDTTLKELIYPCLDSVNEGVEKTHICIDLMEQLFQTQNERIKAINTIWNQYAIDGIQPDKKRKIAITDTKDYYAAYILAPKIKNKEDLSKDSMEWLNNQYAVFDANNDAFICALELYNCKQYSSSTHFFELINYYNSGKTNQLLKKEINTTNENIPVGTEGIRLFDLSKNKHDIMNTHHALVEYYIMTTKPEKGLNPVVQDYKNARSEAVSDCMEKFRAKMPNMLISYDNVKIKETCYNTTCVIDLMYLDTYFGCDFPQYDAEYQNLIKEHPELAIGPYQP